MRAVVAEPAPGSGLRDCARRGFARQSPRCPRQRTIGGEVALGAVGDEFAFRVFQAFPQLGQPAFEKLAGFRGCAKAPSPIGSDKRLGPVIGDPRGQGGIGAFEPDIDQIELPTGTMLTFARSVRRLCFRILLRWDRDRKPRQMRGCPKVRHRA